MTTSAWKISFTDRTCLVVTHARQFAHARHGKAISSRDLLYGLVAEGSGVAANVLAQYRSTFGIRLTPPYAIGSAERERIRSEAILEIQKLECEAKELMQCAIDEACECRNKWPDETIPVAWVGTEHLLLALTRLEQTAGAKLLRSEAAKAGFCLVDVRNLVLELIGLL